MEPSHSTIHDQKDITIKKEKQKTPPQQRQPPLTTRQNTKHGAPAFRGNSRGEGVFVRRSLQNIIKLQPRNATAYHRRASNDKKLQPLRVITSTVKNRRNTLNWLLKLKSNTQPLKEHFTTRTRSALLFSTKIALSRLQKPTFILLRTTKSRQQ